MSSRDQKSAKALAASWMERLGYVEERIGSASRRLRVQNQSIDCQRKKEQVRHTLVIDEDLRSTEAIR